MTQQLHNIERALANPNNYIIAIEKLYKKYSQKKKLYDVNYAGVSFANFIFHKEKLAKILANDIAAKNYQLEPVNTKKIQTKRKTRCIYSFTVTDLIVLSVLFDILREHARKILSPYLFSYQKGLSSSHAIQYFSAYLNNHRTTIKNVKSRGLYILKADFLAYSDTVPVHPNAYIWKILQQLINIADPEASISDYTWQLIEQAVRPNVLNKQDQLYQNIFGTPTGSPIIALLNNLAAHPLDTYLGNISGGFYMRYSDDFLFAHPDPLIVQQADIESEKILNEIGLIRNPQKTEKIYFNGAGCEASEHKHFKGKSVIELLGNNIHFNNGISLSKKHIKIIMANIKRNIYATYQLSHGEPIDKQGQLICNALNQAILQDSIFQIPRLSLIYNNATDRKQLKQMDLLIAKYIASIISKKPLNKAFRDIPYKTIRQNWHLISLCHYKNQLDKNKV